MADSRGAAAAARMRRRRRIEDAVARLDHARRLDLDDERTSRLSALLADVGGPLAADRTMDAAARLLLRVEAEERGLEAVEVTFSLARRDPSAEPELPTRCPRGDVARDEEQAIAFQLDRIPGISLEVIVSDKREDFRRQLGMPAEARPRGRGRREEVRLSTSEELLTALRQLVAIGAISLDARRAEVFREWSSREAPGEGLAPKDRARHVRHWQKIRDGGVAAIREAVELWNGLPEGIRRREPWRRPPRAPEGRELMRELPPLRRDARGEWSVVAPYAGRRRRGPAITQETAVPFMRVEPLGRMLVLAACDPSLVVARSDVVSAASPRLRRAVARRLDRAGQASPIVRPLRGGFRLAKVAGLLAREEGLLARLAGRIAGPRRRR